VKVQPKGARNEIEKVEEGRLKIKVTVPPEGGKANKAIIEILAKALKVPKSSIEIKRGTTSRIKTIEIFGITADELKEKLNIPIEKLS
jgi:uncharacterized protein (TIGR00251 family)